MADRRLVMPSVIVGAVNVLIFQHFVPNVADIKSAPAMDTTIEKSERTALFAATGFTALVAGFSRSLEVFAIGGAVIIALDFAVKHANATNPQSGKIEQSTSQMYPMPDYQS